MAAYAALLLFKHGHSKVPGLAETPSIRNKIGATSFIGHRLREHGEITLFVRSVFQRQGRPFQSAKVS